MTPHEFNKATRELLADVWGEKAYPPAMIQKLWQIVGGITVQEFKLGLETLSMTVNRAPALGQIRGACLPAIMKASQKATELRIKQLEATGMICPLCDNGGYVWVIPFDDPTAEGVFLCNCEASRVRGFLPNHGMTYWHPDLEHKYFVRRFTGPGWLAAQKIQDEGFAKLREGTKPNKKEPNAKLRDLRRQLLSVRAKLLTKQITSAEALALVEQVRREIREHDASTQQGV